MKSRIFSFLVLVVVLVLVRAADAPKKPAILAVTRPPSEGWESGAHYKLIAKPLVDAGFEVDVCMEDDLPKVLASGKYNALVYAPLVVSVLDETQRQTYNKIFPAIQKALADFMAKGGGVFIMSPCDQEYLIASRILTEPWGARILVEEIKDPAGDKDYFVKWLHTTQVAGPVTNGVHGVWYPSSGGKWTWPLEVDKNWTVVLQAEKSAKAQFATCNAEMDKARRKEPLTGPVPLAAIRTMGAGRLAIMGVPHTYSFMAPFDFPGATAFLVEGIEGKPSDARRLIFNILQWLSEPSMKAGMGGATTPEKMLKPYSRMSVDKTPLVNWRPELGAPPKTIKGLAGARTLLSSGKSTVAEYAKAAKEAGLGFLVFLEDHKLMTPEKNEQLRKECLAASDATFQAIPGFTIEDEFGTHWFWAGNDTSYPNDTYLSADKKALAGNYGKGEARAKTLGAALCDMMFHQYIARVRTGSWNHKSNAYPALDHRDYSAMAPVTTTEEGKPIDDSFDDLGAIQNLGANVQPWALELMNSASQVADRAVHGYGIFVRAENPTAAAKFVGTHSSTDAMDQYISNGPEIVDFQAGNIPYPALINDKFRADKFRMKLFLYVKSKAGLQEVRVQDGPRLIRRFLPNGEVGFKQTIELFNLPQQNLMILVKDKEGRRAVGKNLSIRCTEFQEVMCGDRNNQMFNGFGVRDDGSVFREAPPTGNGATPDKGTLVWLISPCFPYAYDFRTPNCPWDGGRYGSGYPMRFNPIVTVQGETEKPLHNTPARALHSQDVMVGKARIDGAFPEKFKDHIGMVWNTIYPVEPTRFLEGEMKLTYWRTKPDAFTATFFDGVIRFKKDVTLEGDKPIVVGVLTSGVDNCDYEIRDKDGKIHTGKSKEVPTPVTGVLDDKGYAAYVNKMCTSAFYSLTPGIKFEVAPGSVRFYLAPENRQIKAGTEFKVKILGVGSPLNGPAKVASRADEAFGILSGKPAYTLKLEKGKLLSQRYTLELDGEGVGAAGAIPKFALPAYLPVTVAGLNPNWATVYLDRAGKKWRPVGVLDGAAHVELDPSVSDQSFFIGHPVTCDQKDLWLQLTQTGKTTWSLEAHNPTDKEIKATVQFTKDFTPLTQPPIPVTVPAGQSVVQTIPVE